MYMVPVLEFYDKNSSSPSSSPSTILNNRYENQKQRDWKTFIRYLRSLHLPVAISSWSGEHVVAFLQELDQFGKTKVHNEACSFFGQPGSLSRCPCPRRQAWGSLDALVGRLRAAFDKHGGKTLAANPFGSPEVKLYLSEVRELQAKARGVTLFQTYSLVCSYMFMPVRNFISLRNGPRDFKF